MRVSFIKSAALAVLATAALVACGGGGGDQYAPITSNAVTPATATTAAALTDNGAMRFSTGVAAFGTADSTLNVTANGGAYNFTVAEGGNTASGNLTFGSCIFTVTASTFPAGNALANGATVTVQPCNLIFQTAGQGNTGAPFTAQTTLLLGTSESSPFTETVSVAPGGTQLTITTPSGSVTVAVTTLTGGN